jgi:4-azaleucine resistance transporter AzlC
MMHIKNGICSATPIILGYIPVGIAFGLIAKNEGMPFFFTILLSSVVFAGASQFMAVHAVALGLYFPQIILATFLMNFRHLIMSISIASRLEDDSKNYRPLIAFMVTDESYAVTSLSRSLHHRYLLSVQFIAYLTWNIATIIGFFVGGLLPKLLQQSMGITLYVLFAALLIPEIKRAKEPLIIALIAGLINSLLTYTAWFDGGWNLVISMILAASVGYIIFKEVGEAYE